MHCRRFLALTVAAPVGAALAALERPRYRMGVDRASGPDRSVHVELDVHDEGVVTSSSFAGQGYRWRRIPQPPGSPHRVFALEGTVIP